MTGGADRFWPSLYDRLAMGEAQGLNDFMVDGAKLRDFVKRDLETLLNATALESTLDRGGIHLESFPLVRRSVVNYGMPGLSGVIVSSLTAWRIEEHLQRVIQAYEPRIAPDSVKARVQTDDPDAERGRELIDGEKGLHLEVTGVVHGTPGDFVQLGAYWDMDSGQAAVVVRS